MSGAWKAKRFWTVATVADAPGGFTIHLDAKPLRTPSKAALIVPTRALAQEIAAEWDAQTGLVKPDTMPLTRTANSAIDKVTPQHTEVADMLAAYGASDLLCYRAAHPERLVELQAAGWDPLIDWAATHLDARLAVGVGVMPVAQDAAAIAGLAQRVRALDSFRLAAFHDLVALSGSLILALGVTTGRISPQVGWDLSRIDENWQAQEWGADEEAAATSALKMQAFLTAARFYELLA